MDKYRNSAVCCAMFFIGCSLFGLTVLNAAANNNSKLYSITNLLFTFAVITGGLMVNFILKHREEVALRHTSQQDQPERPLDSHYMCWSPRWKLGH